MNLETLTLPLEVKDGIKTALGAITATVAAFTAAAGFAVNATFKWANELDSIQDVMGVTNKQAAALNFVLRKSGVETTKLTAAETILAKGLKNADGSLGTIGKTLKEYGINVLDANGNVRDQADLIQEISYRYNQLGTQTERVKFLTDAFGRSGGELVDFFDTLAQEGGIDKVTEKIEKFGLAIDPGRYEAFTRSLEELKLIGLGLAIAFTEKIMPVFEKLLEIITDPNLTTPEKIGQIIQAVDKFVGALINSLAQKVNEWVDSGGPATLALKFINWISGIGQSGEGTPSSETVRAMQNLVTAIARALAQVPWQAIGDVIADKFNEQLAKAGITPETAEVILKVAGAILVFVEAFRAITAIVTVISVIAGIFGGITAAITGAFTAAVIFGSYIFEASSLTGALAVAVMALTGSVDALVIVALAGVAMVIAAIGLWVIAIYLLIKNWDDFKLGFLYTCYLLYNAMVDLGDKLKSVWDSVVTSLKNGWEDFKSSAIDAINSVINALNNIPYVNIPLISTGSSSNGNGNNHRASGGPVIAGQSYNVAEFSRPEVFIPNQSGRVDKKENTTTTLDIDYSKLARTLTSELLKAGIGG